MKPYEAIQPSHFWKLVDRSPGHGPDGDCHLWSGPMLEGGRGAYPIRISGRTINFKAHRAAHWLYYGYMPDNLFCIRACGCHSCVNPSHLYLWNSKGGAAAARLLRDVDMAPGLGPQGSCWEFTKYREKKYGYGTITNDLSKFAFAHRFMFEIYNGPVCDAGMVLHRCDNGACCNPGHLYLGDHAQNMRDRNARNRTARVRGHYKITEDEAKLIKNDPRKHADIATAYGVSRTTVSYIKSGRRWVGLRSGAT